MKKLKVLGVAAIAAGMFSLTSCLDGGGNTQQLSSYAIVDYSSTMRTLIRIRGGESDGLTDIYTVLFFSHRDMRMPVQTVFMWRQERLLLH